MSLPGSPVADDIETDPSEEEEEVEEEIEEEEVEEEVEEEDDEEVEEEEVEEVEEEEVEEVEEVEEMEVGEEEEEEEDEGQQEVEEVEVEEEDAEGDEEVEEVEVEEEEEEEEQEEVEVEEVKVEEEEEVGEVEEGEGEKQEEEAVEEKKEEQQHKQQEEVVEEKEGQQKQPEEAVEEKEGQHKQQKAAAGEDKAAVPGSPPDADKDHEDLSQHMESEEKDQNLRPDSSLAENPEIMPPSSMHCMEENDAMLKTSVPSCEIMTLKKEELHLKYDISNDAKSRENPTSVEDCKSQGLDVDVENAGSLLQKETLGVYSEAGCNTKANLNNENDIDSRARATKSSSDTGQGMVTGLLPKDCLVEDAYGGQNSSNKITQLEIVSRDDVKQMPSRTRSLSPSAEIRNGNKRPKMICDFFAKGWCIRGSSCSFLHIKDTEDKTDQEAETDVDTTHQKRELKVEEGVRENVQRSRMNDYEAIPSWHQSQEKQNFKMKDNLFSDNRFAFSSTNNFFSPNQDGIATLRNQHMYKGYASTLLSHSPNSSLVTQFPASSMSLSHRISTQSGCSLPLSSSLGASNVNSQNLLNTDKECLTSKSTFSGSGREDFPLVSSSRVPSYPTGYKSKICSYDWEPSVPFRPSFFITSMNVSSAGDLYDPLRDSIEIPNIGDGSLKASLLIQGSNVQASSQVQIYGNSDVVGKHTPSLNDDKSSVSSHNKFNENDPNNNYVPHEKDYLPTETEITSGTYVNYQNDRMGQNTFCIADSTKKERDMTEHDARRHSEGSGHKTKRVDRDKKNHDMDIDVQMDGSTQKEPKALKMLRAALVDHVKELLKPAWHEGRLSKDAHIMIVRKSVDKVVSTIEPHQIPTIDTAKQYVSSSRMKIAKLVNGYVNKYGKS